MLLPKKTKYRKAFKGRIHGASKAGTALNFGSYGLKALEPERVTARQIEAARRAITRQMKRQGRVWIRIFPDLPISARPARPRGLGQGSGEYWAERVDPAAMFEIDGVPDDGSAGPALGAAKLPIRARCDRPTPASCASRRRRMAKKIEQYAARRRNSRRRADQLKGQFNCASRRNRAA